MNTTKFMFSSRIVLICASLVLILSVLFNFVLRPPLSAQAKSNGARLPVLMYHYISVPPSLLDITRVRLSVIPGLFEQQMKWLSTHGYNTVSGDQAVAALTTGVALPAHSVLLTFDDGYEDAYTNAFSILKKYHLVGTFFIVTDWIDQNRAGYLTWAQVREMAASGMTIGGHSRTHDSLVGPNSRWLTDEIDNSLADIQKQIGIRPLLFAYPFGQYDSNTLKVIKESGVSVAFTTSTGIANSAGDPFTEPRLRISGGTTAAGFAAELHDDGF